MSLSLQRLVFAVLLLPLCYSGDDQPSLLEQVQQRGSITVLSRSGASSYYEDANGPTGPEFELAQAFAEFLGVEMQLQLVDAFGQLEDRLLQGSGEMIAANLSRTQAREQRFNFGPDYLETSTLVISRRGKKQPKNVADLVGRKIMVISGSSYVEALEQARLEYPGLNWETRDDVGIESLLLAIADKAIDITLVDSSVFEMHKAFYPRLEVAFSLPGTVPHAWAFPPGDDVSLVESANTFMQQARENGLLAGIMQEFYEGIASHEPFDMVHFLQRVRERLPNLIGAFQEAGEIYGVDWRLLAAIGYQESHWDPEATSFTGVRGVMMLTEQTARQLGVTDRLDPYQSIDGGGRYLARLRDRLPERIPEPDRTWMALAGYNLGLGHLRDARKLTQMQGLDPDSWTDVRKCLGLLTQEEWFSKTRHGYARGNEARAFVDSIQRYYEILIWMDTRDHPLLLTKL
ncbi:MAG TPA: membrane-bound lytic murein transglycosylase MltF [Xanthomonadales bacterium]|nr:membrane-bound lytic murein transglycosylase MltF [Xanthomonadales bacterium]